MRRSSKTLSAMLTAASLAALSGLACSSTDSGGSACDSYTNYKATVAGPISFATDIYPLLIDTSATTGGCAQAGICHGLMPGGLDDIFAPTKFMQFLYDPPDPAMAKAQLMMASLNAPTMMRVSAGNVGQSFMAYKIAANRADLACVNSMCVAGASVGNNMPCGDLMPSVGPTLSAANRTKILDWIALGAAN